MNPLIKKEIRLLLPGALIGCGLAAFNALPGRMWGQEYTELAGLRGVIIFLLCPTMAIMIALNSFGVEVTTGTFTSLLAQPVARLKIWQTKIVLLAVALLAMGSMWTFAVSVHYAKSPGDLYELSGWMVLFVLAVYSGALWTVLLLRQAAAAFWFTVLVPGTILVIFAGLFNGDNDDVIEGVLVIALGIYTLTGLFFARWLFLRAQDVQWSGGTIAMPEMRGSPAWLSRLTAWRATHPTLALCRKEFQLQQSQFVMAFVLVILHLGVLATRNLGHFKKNSDTEYILQSFWFLWLAMPFIVGCTAVAEERKLGTHEGQLCLPVKRHTQFTIKLGMVLFLSVLFGAVMPSLFEWQGFLRENGREFFFVIAGISAGTGMISFYISSLTRATLQGLAPALGYIVILVFLGLQAKIETRAPDPLWGSNLIFFIGIPVIALVFLALAYRNFRELTVSLGVWLKNLLTLAITLVFVIVATTATYYRIWEKLTPFEPPHGPARLTLAAPARISQWGAESFIRLPNGRIWIDYFSQKPTGFLNTVLGNFLLATNSGAYLPGSDWLKIRQAPRQQLVGIKNDGTLWVSGKPWPEGSENEQQYQKNQEAMRLLVQFGNDTNWNGLQRVNEFVLLTKTDGTLWRWGPSRYKNDPQHPWPGLQGFTPERIGTESNWAGIDEMDFLHKTDGSVWAQENFPSDNMGMKINNNWVFHPATGTMPGNVRSSVDIWRWNRMQVGVLDNGQLNIWAIEHLENEGKKNSYWEWIVTDHPIGQDTNWLAVASSERGLVSLRNDGTLWLWYLKPFDQSGWIDVNTAYRELQSATAARLGTHSDWIAITSGYGYILSLAADGSLWYWPIESLSYDRQFFSTGAYAPDSLLDISHKPQYLGNIFD